MRTLYIMRHAKSSWKDASLKDHDRPLNKRGKRDAPLMGKILSAKRIKPGAIISSTAKRAVKTAGFIAEALDYPEKSIQCDARIYENDPDVLLQLIREVDDAHDALMIIGHNPSFTELANQLGRNVFENIPTCGIVCYQFAVDRWKDIREKQGHLEFFEYPKLHL